MILVTGATGFLGAELVGQLALTESKIRCLKRISSEIPSKLINYQSKIEWIEADILDFADLETAFEGITKVYHCAAIVSFNKADKYKLLSVNVEGTANIVNLCLQNRIQKLIHVSSIAALGKANTTGMIDENSFWEGFETHSTYAVSKYRSEMEIWRGIHEGLHAVIVNPSLIIGTDAGDKGTGAIFHAIKNGVPGYPSGGNGWVTVEDVAASMILLMNSDIINERFVINAENLTFKYVFQLTSKELGIKIPEFEIKPWMLKLALPFISLKNLFNNNSSLNQQMIKNIATFSKYQNQKIRTTIGFNFTPVEQSITKIANSLKKP